MTDANDTNGDEQIQKHPVPRRDDGDDDDDGEGEKHPMPERDEQGE